MDDWRFDRITRALASGASRRSVVKALLGFGSAAALGPLAGPEDATAAKRPTPTPKPVKCPGTQIWNGTRCVCQSGVTCGSDCCPTVAQCCDNACCPTGSVCFAEEICCVATQVCGGVCCPSGQTCCGGGSTLCVDLANGGCCADTDCTRLTSACTTGVCNPSTHQCIAVPATDGISCGECAVCQAGICDSCSQPSICCNGSTCVDPTTGGCCDTDDCAPSTDPCLTNICDLSTYRCIAVAVEDGVACGDACETCTDGVCSVCDAPLKCCEGTTCVDPTNGGCCTAADCPPSNDPCRTYACQGHQCVEVAQITCPVDQECVDGECVCTDGRSPCGEGDTAVCCPSGETCKTESDGGPNVSICCPGHACGSYGNGVVCCDTAAGEKCERADFDGVPFSMCCFGPLCADVNGPFCCPAGENCSFFDVPGNPGGSCCPDGIDACGDLNGNRVCCTTGTCQLVETPGQGKVTICCEGWPCGFGPAGLTCCAVGEICDPQLGCQAPA